MRNWTTRTALGLVMTVLAGTLGGLAGPAGPAQAQSGSAAAPAGQQRDFDIPAQPLTEALTQFGIQAGLQVSVHGATVQGLASPGVRGRMTPGAALDRLLAGSGLLYRIEGGNTVTLSRSGADRSGATELAPVRVEGDVGGNQAIQATRTEWQLRSPADLQDVFANEPSVSVGSSIPLSQKLYVNGIEETNLAVSIDGARQNNRVFHHNATTLIDPSLLKAVRVDPGIAPADAGPAAIGGAVVFETVDAADVLRPGRNFGGFVQSRFETNGNTLANSVSVYGREDGVEILGFFNKAEGDDYETGDGRSTDGTAAALTSGLAKTAFEAPTGHRVEFSFERVSDDSIRPFRANFQGLNGVRQLRNYDLTRENYVFSYQDASPTELFDPELVVGYGSTDLEVLSPFGSIGKTDSLSGKLQNTFHLAPGDVTAGIDFYRDKAAYKDPTDAYREEADNVGLYAQARLQPLPDVRLSFGARGDRQAFTGTDGTRLDEQGLSGNVRGEYDVLEMATLSAGYAHVWGGIALAENFIQNPAWSYAGGIEPVQSDNVTVGITTWHGGFTFAANAHASRLHEVRDPNFRTGPGIVVDFESRGFDLELGFAWAQGSVTARYARTDVELEGQYPDSDATQYIGTPLGETVVVDARHTLAGWGLSFGGLLLVALDDDQPRDIGLQPVDGYTTVDLYAEYVPAFLPALTTRLAVKNLFDENYADRATYGQEFATVEPMFEPGRSVILSARLEF